MSDGFDRRTFTVPMRDGVCLATDVYLPPGGEPAPALLMRTPYNKLVAETEAYAHPAWYAFHGFAVVVQDVRGTYASEGDLQPFHSEAEDGYDTIEWVAGQEWCSGRVGMYGFSYAGAAQLLAATLSPPALAAIAPAMTGSSYHEGWTYHGGALQLAFVLSWTASLGRIKAVRAGDAAAVRAFDGVLADLPRFYSVTPPGSAFPDEVMPYITFLEEWLAHPAYDSYWRAIAPKEHFPVLGGIPALHVGGWYDIFVEGTIENFTGMSAGGAPQSLVVGPWYHMPWAPTMNGHDLSPRARNTVDDTQLRFFRRHLADSGTEPDPVVEVFVLGANEWVRFDTWPPRARDRRLYLHSEGRAGSVSGTGGLGPDEPDGPHPPDVWVSEARNPVPSLGGRSGSYASRAPMGPADQRPVEMRNDVLLYTSEPLTEPTTVIGSPEVMLFVASDSPSYDLVVRLVDVRTDGTSVNVSDGNVRLDGESAGGEPSAVTISLSPTAVRFAAGHRIRLHVAGSSHPTLDLAASGVVTNVVCHDSGRPSRLTLPVIGADT